MLSSHQRPVPRTLKRCGNKPGNYCNTRRAFQPSPRFGSPSNFPGVDQHNLCQPEETSDKLLGPKQFDNFINNMIQDPESVFTYIFSDKHWGVTTNESHLTRVHRKGIKVYIHFFNKLMEKKQKLKEI